MLRGNEMQKLYIMVGNVGSGKSTWIKEFVQRPSEFVENWRVVSKDAFRWMLGGGIYLFDSRIEALIHSWAITVVEELLTTGSNVIYDETNMDKETREPFIDLVEIDPVGIDVYAVVAPRISKGEALKRKAKPSVSYGYSQEEWAEVWERKEGKYEPPVLEEGLSGVYYI
jgi:predicted kinase